MSNRAWMPLHIDAYLADTGHLSALEHGAYLLLIMHYWRNGGLPSDERLIARHAKLTPAQWEESRDVLAAMFLDGWKHKRIDAELQKADAIIEKRRSAANGRHGKSKPDANAVHVDCKSSDTGALPLTKDLSEPSGSAAGAADPRQQLWTEGVSSLKAISGKTEAAAKSMIGKWLRDAGDDCALVLSKIHTARSEQIGEPISWISAAIKPAEKPPPRRGVSGAAQRIMEQEYGTESIFGGNGDAKRLSPASGGGSRDAVADLRGGLGRQFRTIDH